MVHQVIDVYVRCCTTRNKRYFESCNTAIDRERLEKSFPEKWDLADSLPPGKKEKDLKNLLSFANLKACDPGKLLLFQDFKKEEKVFKKIQANEVLWRVDERLRESLEKEHGLGSYEVKNEIESLAESLFSNQEDLKEQLRGQYSLSENILDKLTYQVTLFKAENGKDPNPHDMKNFKKFLINFSHEKLLSKDFDFYKDLSLEGKKHFSFLADSTAFSWGGIVTSCSPSSKRLSTA